MTRRTPTGVKDEVLGCVSSTEKRRGKVIDWGYGTETKIVHVLNIDVFSPS